MRPSLLGCPSRLLDKGYFCAQACCRNAAACPRRQVWTYIRTLYIRGQPASARAPRPAGLGRRRGRGAPQGCANPPPPPRWIAVPRPRSVSSQMQIPRACWEASLRSTPRAHDGPRRLLIAHARRKVNTYMHTSARCVRRCRCASCSAAAAAAAPRVRVPHGRYASATAWGALPHHRPPERASAAPRAHAMPPRADSRYPSVYLVLISGAPLSGFRLRLWGHR